MSHGTEDWRTERRREIRLATACGAMAGAMVGTLLGVFTSVSALYFASPGMAGLTFLGVWALWVVLGALLCWLGSLYGGTHRLIWLGWSPIIGVLAGVLVAIVCQSPSMALEWTLVWGAIGGALLGVFSSRLWRRYFAGR